MSTRKFVPHYYRMNEEIIYDDSTWKTYLSKMPPNSGKDHSALNGGTSISFTYSGQEKYIRWGSPRSGIEIEFAFLTKTGANNDEDANTTLSCGWFWHLFDKVSIRAASEYLEQINNVGVVTEIMNHVRGEEFRKYYGEDVGFIPDEGSGDADDMPVKGTVVVSVANTTANTNAGQAVNLRMANNSKFNNGFK